MFVHLGGNCLIKTADIIGIFSAKEYSKDFFKTLRNRFNNFCEIEDLSEGNNIDSIILTEKKIYLSVISSSTLQKRINQNIVYNNGGNND